jgi:hypothetical protein
MVLVDVIKKREGRNSLSLFLKKIKKILKKLLTNGQACGIIKIQ